MTQPTDKTDKKDPFFAREAKKYVNPIPSREFIMQYLEEVGRPVSRAHLISAFELQTEEDQEALRRRLSAMLRDGQLLQTRRNSYALVDRVSVIAGRVIGSRDGHGFLVPDDGSERIFLSAKQMRLVLPEDRVLISINAGVRGKREGAIVEILERGLTQIVGRYLEKAGVGFVIPSNKAINRELIISRGKDGGAKAGQLVVADIISYPERTGQERNFVGEINEVLGEHNAAGMEIEVAIRAHGLPYKWSDDGIVELDQLSYDITEEIRGVRKGLQHLPFVTIDGEDAKDFDDAVLCEVRENGGWQLSVAIADVGFYVRSYSAIDQEAESRGNSVYFPDYVLPMLPEQLSNDLCSLKPNVERLVMVCEMVIDAQGKITRFCFYEGIIKSHARLTYNKVHLFLENKIDQLDAADVKLIREVSGNLYALRDVHNVLTKQRKIRGALEFDSIETKIIFDEERKIKSIVPSQRNYAHSIIEECMLAANVCASKFLLKHQMPALYRVHEGPDEESLQDLRKFLASMRLNLGGGKKPTTLHFAKLLEEIQGRADEAVIETVVLRSMSQAVYAPENLGHFGLAYKAYVHFTSPIRRYPDLLTHRAIRHVLRGGNMEDFIYDNSNMLHFGEHCSMTERRADDATRDAMQALKCIFIRERLGQTFKGIISGVTGFGLFVVLEEVYIDGLLHVTALPNDYYVFDALKLRLVGRRSGKVFALGDKLEVVVARADVDERQVDFALA